MITGFRKQYTCWICLEESTADRTFIAHECGCNLQVHKRCLVQWLFTLNKKRLDGYEINDFYKINTVRELKRRICYLIDGNKSLHEDVNIVETIQSLPVVGQTWASFICVTDLAVRTTLGLPNPKYRQHEMWRGVPIESVDCPQCRKKLTSHPIQYTSRSPALSLLRLFKQANRFTAVILLCVSSSTNILKWWFKGALWQLRCLLPESVLRRALGVATTRALDVYSDNMSGFRSITQEVKLLIFGFPVYLASLRFSRSLFSHLRFLYPFLLLRHQHNHNLLSKISSFTEIFMFIYPLVMGNLSNSIVHRWLAKSQPYFFEPKWDGEFQSYSYIPTEDTDPSNVVIKLNWCDVLVENFIWPWLGQQVARTILSRVAWITSFLLQISPEASPHECECALNIIGCLTIVLVKDVAKLYLTFRRLKELEAFHDFIKLT